jgi:predicted TIM-barrel fold metal-dependent hydrolase
MLYETELFGEERIFPFFTIFPGYEEGAQAEEIERLAKANVIFGLKLHTLATRSKATDLEGSPFIEVAQEYSLPLLIHSRDDEYSDPNNIVELAKVYPDLRFCVAHAAMFNERIFEIARAQGNLFIDVVPLLTLCNIASGKIAEGRAQGLLELPYEDPLAVLRQLANRFPELILWGTDEPWTTVTNDQTKGVHLKSSYKAEVSILDLLPEDARRNISNVNTIKFLFGS